MLNEAKEDVIEHRQRPTRKENPGPPLPLFSQHTAVIASHFA